jgi:hypothetical protein
VTSSADWNSLLGDLAWLATRLIDRAYVQSGDEDERTHLTLARIVMNIVGQERWRRSPGQAASSVIYAAIQRLPKEMSGRSPKSPLGSIGNALWKGHPERTVAEIMYGYRDGDVPDRYSEDGSRVTIRTYDEDYLPTALAVAGASNAGKRSQGRITEVIREDLANALFQLVSRNPDIFTWRCCRRAS